MRNLLSEKSRYISEKVVHIAKRLKKIDYEFVLSDQFLRSGTSVGANIAEAGAPHSRADFVLKLTIAKKECCEVLYWIGLLRIGEYINKQEFDELIEVYSEIKKLLSASILTAKYGRNSK